ncbi:MAG: hypothetical protein K6F05_08260 [Succinivibrio sp.]|nr:hypothetical protein [Succinivibrio sp.]
MQMPDNLVILEQSASGFEVSFKIPENLLYLQGHFPIKQLLPGVVQVGWVYELTRRLLKPRLQLASISQLKFSAPIMPNDEVYLKVKLHDASLKLDFSYELKLNEHQLLSSKGRLTYVEEA